MRIALPYGRGQMEAEIAEGRIARILSSRMEEYRPEGGEDELVQRALQRPIGSAPLCELAKDKQKVVLIASDHTRPVPSKKIVPAMLGEIRKGNPEAEITILIATGCHRGTTERELIEKFGEEIVRRERILVHDCEKDEEMIHLGTLPSGGTLLLNRIAVQADLLVAEGFIEPHFFAGFSGGRKSVLPGIASKHTVYANHCSKFLADPRSRAGILEGNPIHKDMVFAARQAKLAFICNVVINAKHEVIGAFAGDVEGAHEAGVRLVRELCESPIEEETEIVITSNNGYPLDQNAYQAVKGISTAENAVKQGGVIIMLAKCEDGIGGDGFYKTFSKDRSAAHILECIQQVPQDQTAADQWQSQVFARALNKAHVILISDLSEEQTEALHMEKAKDIGEAIGMADGYLGKQDGRITVIPEGITSILTK